MVTSLRFPSWQLGHLDACPSLRSKALRLPPGSVGWGRSGWLGMTLPLATALPAEAREQLCPHPGPATFSRPLFWAASLGILLVPPAN